MPSVENFRNNCKICTSKKKLNLYHFLNCRKRIKKLFFVPSQKKTYFVKWHLFSFEISSKLIKSAKISVMLWMKCSDAWPTLNLRFIAIFIYSQVIWFSNFHYWSNFIFLFSLEIMKNTALRYWVLLKIFRYTISSKQLTIGKFD